jgi:hypothetical protein
MALVVKERWPGGVPVLSGVKRTLTAGFFVVNTGG